MNSSTLISAITMLGAIAGGLGNPAQQAPLAPGADAAQLLESVTEATWPQGLEPRVIYSMTLSGHATLATTSEQHVVEASIQIFADLHSDRYVRVEVIHDKSGRERTTASGFDGQQPLAAAGASQIKALDKILPEQRDDCARLLLALFGVSMNGQHLIATYVERDVQSGQDVVDVVGVGGFQARVFIDPRTHHIRSLHYERSEHNARHRERESVRMQLSTYEQDGDVVLPRRIEWPNGSGGIDVVSVDHVAVNSPIEAEVFHKWATPRY